MRDSIYIARPLPQRGFTLIELLVTMALTIILMAATVPGFLSTVQNNRLSADTNRIVADVQFARSEAIHRGSRVVLCRTAAPTAGTPLCGGSSHDWSSGWLVFADTDSDGSFTSGTDTLLRVSQATHSGHSIKANDVSDATLEFNPDATTNENGNTAAFAVCDSRGTAQGRRIEIPPVGRPRLADSVDSCTDPA